MEGYGRLLHSPTRFLARGLEGNAANSTSEDIEDPISEDEDPFADPVSLVSYKPKPSLLPSPPHKQEHKGKAAKSTARPQYREDEDQFRRSALTDKSTNHPILTQPIAVGVAYGSAAAITFLQPPKSGALLSPKLHLKKEPRLDSQSTPQVILEVEPPTRPRKSRQAGPPLEGQDFPTTLSPSKARMADYKSHPRKYTGISEGGSDRPYYEPPTLLGISDTRMNDSIGTISGTWVRERAKNIFGGTKKVAERVLGVSPSSARYKYRPWEGETPKLKARVIQKRREIQTRRIAKHPVPNPVSTSGIESSAGDVVSLQDFLEDPFSLPGDYGLDRNMDAKEDDGSSVELGHAEGPNGEIRNRLWRPESIQNLLVLGSPKTRYIHAEKAATTKQSDTRYCIKENGSPVSSFLATTGINPGTACGFNHLDSDNEMLSSSPIAKSTPKKDWHRYEGRDATNILKWETNSRTRGKPPNPAKPMITALDSSDTDCLEGVATGGNEFDGNSRDERDKGVEFYTKSNGGEAGGSRKNSQEQKALVARLRRTKNPLRRVAGPEDEHCEDQYGIGISGSDTAEEEKDYCPLEISIDGAFESEEDRMITSTIARTSIIDLEEEVNPRKRCGDVRTRTGKPLSKDKKTRLTGRTEGVAVNSSHSRSNRAVVSRVISKIATGRKKEIKRRKFSLGYDGMEMDDDVDELQMDWPGIRI